VGAASRPAEIAFNADRTQTKSIFLFPALLFKYDFYNDYQLLKENIRGVGRLRWRRAENTLGNVLPYVLLTLTAYP
jgi:hypothetical protein